MCVSNTLFNVLFLVGVDVDYIRHIKHNRVFTVNRHFSLLTSYFKTFEIEITCLNAIYKSCYVLLFQSLTLEKIL